MVYKSLHAILGPMLRNILYIHLDMGFHHCFHLKQFWDCGKIWGNYADFSGFEEDSPSEVVFEPRNLRLNSPMEEFGG